MNLILLNFPKIFFKYRSLIRAVYIPCQKFDDLFPSTSALHPPAHLTPIELGQENIIIFIDWCRKGWAVIKLQTG
jgi:hypothetical protein